MGPALFLAAADQEEGSGEQSEGIAAGSEVHFRDLHASLAEVGEGESGDAEEKQGHSDGFHHGGDVAMEAAGRQVLEERRSTGRSSCFAEAA